MSARIVEFSGVSNNIPAALRAAADRIESGEYPDLQFVAAVFVDRSAAFTAFSWGECSTLEAIGALARAVRCDLVE
jgi:hypothetical protein